MTSQNSVPQRFDDDICSLPQEELLTSSELLDKGQDRRLLQIEGPTMIDTNQQHLQEGLDLENIPTGGLVNITTDKERNNLLDVGLLPHNEDLEQVLYLEKWIPKNWRDVEMK